MSDYQTLFDIRVEHDYFVDGICPCLDFVPTHETLRVMRNTGVLMRRSTQGLWLAYDRVSQDALQLQIAADAEGLDLVFRVYATDPQFRSYTEPFADRVRGLLYFTNRGLSAVRGKPVKLHSGKTVSDQDLTDMESEQLSGIVDRKDRSMPPVGIIRIHADKRNNPLFDKRNKPRAPSYHLLFTSRQTYWKYYLQGDRSGEDIYVVDAEGRIEFEATGPDRLANGRSVSTYRSKQRIPLQQRFDFRFQLKQRKHGVEKVLYRQLPFARVDQTGKEVVAQQAIAVSEIYINY
jgi:hypothetical protein